MLFSFFQEATSQAVPSIVTQESIVRKTQFPRLVIPLAVVVTSLFNLGLNLVVVFVFLLAFGIDPMWTWLLLPVLIGGFFVLTTAVSMIVSSLYPRFRDLAIIWSVLSLALFYATPVLYPIEAAPETFRKIIMLNPITPMLQLGREWFIDPGAPDLAQLAGGGAVLLVPLALYVLICVVAVWVFDREAPRIAEEL